jgi:hypothetical protein
MHASTVLALFAIPLTVFAQCFDPVGTVSDLVEAHVNATIERREAEANGLEKRLSCPNGHTDASSCFQDICVGVDGVDQNCDLDAIAW